MKKLWPKLWPQFWIVGYVNATIEDSLQDLKHAQEQGADGIVFESSDFEKLDAALKTLRAHAPEFPMGVNFLGPKERLHTYSETFELAGAHKLQIAWTDFSGVDLIEEAPEVSLHHIEFHRAKAAALSPGLFYCSGIHMKYSTLKDPSKPIERSALQAMGWVDGMIITGPKTGVAPIPEHARRVREVIGKFPLGAASGVSAENVGQILPFIDFILVNSSIADANHRILPEKVRALRVAMDSSQLLF